MVSKDSEIEKKYEKYLVDLYYDEKDDEEEIKKNKDEEEIKKNKNYEPSLKEQLLSYERDHGSIASIPIQESCLRNPDKSLTFEKKNNEKYDIGGMDDRSSNVMDNLSNRVHDNKVENIHNSTRDNNVQDKYYIKTESKPFPNLSLKSKKSSIEDMSNLTNDQRLKTEDKADKIKSISNNKRSFDTSSRSSINNGRISATENEQIAIENNEISDKNKKRVNRIGGTSLHKKSVFDHDNSKTTKEFDEDNDSKFIIFISIILIIFILFMMIYGLFLITGQSIFDYFS